MGQTPGQLTRVHAVLHQYSLDRAVLTPTRAQPAPHEVSIHGGTPGSIVRAPTDGQLRLITKVARMYHERGIRQTDIADTLHVSQARVSRLLKRAAELRIVRTVVAVAPGLHTEVEEALEEKYASQKP